MRRRLAYRMRLAVFPLQGVLFVFVVLVMLFGGFLGDFTEFRVALNVPVEPVCRLGKCCYTER